MRLVGFVRRAIALHRCPPKRSVRRPYTTRTRIRVVRSTWSQLTRFPPPCRSCRSFLFVRPEPPARQFYFMRNESTRRESFSYDFPPYRARHTIVTRVTTCSIFSYATPIVLKNRNARAKSAPTTHPVGYESANSKRRSIAEGQATNSKVVQAWLFVISYALLLKVVTNSTKLYAWNRNAYKSPTVVYWQTILKEMVRGFMINIWIDIVDFSRMSTLYDIAFSVRSSSNHSTRTRLVMSTGSSSASPPDGAESSTTGKHDSI